jgi:hypothetical protein
VSVVERHVHVGGSANFDRFAEGAASGDAESAPVLQIVSSTLVNDYCIVSCSGDLGGQLIKSSVSSPPVPLPVDRRWYSRGRK